MTQLADHQILNAIEDGDISITPFDESLLQPASVDLQLGNDFTFYRHDSVLDMKPIDPLVGVPEEELERLRINDGFKYRLEPGEFVLACTMQLIKLSPRILARIEGRSTIGRYGVAVHVTAGFVDPGFTGQLTLEIKNENRRPIILTAGMGIAQLSFTRLGLGARRPYGHKDLGSKYQGQSGATGPLALKGAAAALVSMDHSGRLLCERCGEFQTTVSMSGWPAQIIMDEHQRWYCKAPDPLRRTADA